MRLAHLTPIIPLAALLTLAGCSTFSSDSDSSSSSNSGSSSSSASTSTSSNSSSERRASDSSRDDKSTSPSSRDSRSASTTTGGDAGKGDLVAQLNEASRELASLRAANAKLRAEKSSAPAPAPTMSSSSSASRSTPADDRLNQTLRSYSQFRQELTGIIADIEKLRSDNATLSSQLKEASTKAQQASSAAAKLEKELTAERDARVDAEKTIASLREQLRAVAKAVKEAGVPLDPAARSGR
jgi:chromosome segregation ATPase